jgi:glycosyltransferase involved in cell wall biosynthesis
MPDSESAAPPRVALFADSYYEANGVARTVGALESCAATRGVALLSVHAGPATRRVERGSVITLELRRARLTSFRLEHDLSFDLGLWRHIGLVARELRRFKPDVLHFTGPSDIGQLGAFLGLFLNIPMLASWHTNLHEYASRRLQLHWATDHMRSAVRRLAEREVLRLSLQFYRLPCVVMAPNDELMAMLTRRIRKPVFLMARGVDTHLFSPARRCRTDDGVNIGYVGRLSAEKNVRLLPAVEAALREAGVSGVRFTIVGDGNEREWLRARMTAAEFTGVLRGDALSTAYANMDLFVFPSETETVGNVVLEAMASGVPVVAMARGGPRFITEHGRSAVLAADEGSFIEAAKDLVRDPERRAAMQQAARARALELSWERIFADVCQAYQTAVAIAGRDAAHERAADDERRAAAAIAKREVTWPG